MDATENLPKATDDNNIEIIHEKEMSPPKIKEEPKDDNSKKTIQEDMNGCLFDLFSSFYCKEEHTQSDIENVAEVRANVENVSVKEAEKEIDIPPEVIEIKLPEKKVHKCDKCEYKAKYKYVLKTHKYKHTNVRPYKCDECDYRAKNLWHLRSHKFVHTDSRRFVCTTCKHRFAKQEELEEHKKKHSGERPFKCDLCSYSAKSKFIVDVHKRKHEKK